VEIHESARKHGVADQDILHAIDHALVIEDAGDDPDRWLVVGPDRAGKPPGGGCSDHGGSLAAGYSRDADARQVPQAARDMTEPRVYGHTRSGRPITDTEVEALATEAEAGYDVDVLLARRPKRGRPSLGSAPATVESVRLDPELRLELAERARSEGTTTSEIIREALRRFLRAA